MSPTVSRMTSIHLNSLPDAAETMHSPIIAGMNPISSIRMPKMTVASGSMMSARMDQLPWTSSLLRMPLMTEPYPAMSTVTLSTVGKYPGPMRNADPNG